MKIKERPPGSAEGFEAQTPILLLLCSASYAAWLLPFSGPLFGFS